MRQHCGGAATEAQPSHGFDGAARTPSQTRRAASRRVDPRSRATWIRPLHSRGRRAARLRDDVRRLQSATIEAGRLQAGSAGANLTHQKFGKAAVISIAARPWKGGNAWRPTSAPVHLSSIYIYPVKSLRGCSVAAAEIDDLGLIRDRRFLVVDETGRFLTQRALPRMALIETVLSARVLTLSASGHGAVTIDRAVNPTSPLRRVAVWSS